VTPDSAWILWETDQGEGSRVDYGPTEAYGEVACGILTPTLPGNDPAEEETQVHEAQLVGLEPDSLVYYRVSTGDLVTASGRFRTAPVGGDFTRLIAMSDSQQDFRRPDQFADLVHDGILPWLSATTGETDPVDSLHLVVMPGDLVDVGWIRDQWVNAFFASAEPLFSQVPLYPALGNHEGYSPLYFRYFHVPGDGLAERYYTVTRNNLRVIALDSNAPPDGAQLDWLEAQLDLACGDPAIDFVFAQLHHPFHSELWMDGEEGFTGEVIARLDAFTADCAKPTIHFFGHTHAYSRGESSTHRHLFVNVASAGGALDRFGSPGQKDYEEYAISDDAYGFVEVEVTAGADPSFRMRRISLGNPDEPKDNVVVDEITVHRFNAAPQRPTPASPTTFSLCDGAPILAASPFSDPDGQAHHGTQWEIAQDCSDFSAPLALRWRQDRNLWGGVDLQAGDDLSDEPFAEIGPGAACWRVRYRDDGLMFSDWSEPQAITVAACP
jgi:hypothetical protein